jgi:hypothetical protein
MVAKGGHFFGHFCDFLPSIKGSIAAVRRPRDLIRDSTKAVMLENLKLYFVKRSNTAAPHSLEIDSGVPVSAPLQSKGARHYCVWTRVTGTWLSVVNSSSSFSRLRECTASRCLYLPLWPENYGKLLTLAFTIYNIQWKLLTSLVRYVIRIVDIPLHQTKGGSF